MDNSDLKNMLNKLIITFNLLGKINMLKPHTSIFKSQYTIWQGLTSEINQLS